MSDAIELATALRDLVDVLIPGDDPWPAASLVGVHGVLAMRLVEVRGADAVERLHATIRECGGPLAPLNEAQRTKVIETFEQADPNFFKLVRKATYFAYYEHPAVILAIRNLGQPYKAVPIFEGYPLPPFDPNRDRPQHDRGRWIRTEEVRRVDLAPLHNEERADDHER